MNPDYEKQYKTISDKVSASFKNCSIAMLGDTLTDPSITGATGANYAVSFASSDLIPPIRYNVKGYYPCAVRLRAIVRQPTTKITPVKVSKSDATTNNFRLTYI